MHICRINLVKRGVQQIETRALWRLSVCLIGKEFRRLFCRHLYFDSITFGRLPIIPNVNIINFEICLD